MTTPIIRRTRERRRPPGGLCPCRRRRQRSLHRPRGGRLALLLHLSPLRPLGRGGDHRRQHHRPCVLPRPVRVAHLLRRPAAGRGRGGVGRHARLGAARPPSAAGTGTWRTPASTGTAFSAWGSSARPISTDWERFTGWTGPGRRPAPVVRPQRPARALLRLPRSVPAGARRWVPAVLHGARGRRRAVHRRRVQRRPPALAGPGPGAAHGPLPAGRAATHAAGVVLRLPPRRPLVPGLPTPRHPLSRLGRSARLARHAAAHLQHHEVAVPLGRPGAEPAHLQDPLLLRGAALRPGALGTGTACCRTTARRPATRCRGRRSSSRSDWRSAPAPAPAPSTPGRSPSQRSTVPVPGRAAARRCR